MTASLSESYRNAVCVEQEGKDDPIVEVHVILSKTDFERYSALASTFDCGIDVWLSKAVVHYEEHCNRMIMQARVKK